MYTDIHVYSLIYTYIYYDSFIQSPISYLSYVQNLESVLIHLCSTSYIHILIHFYLLHTIAK